MLRTLRAPRRTALPRTALPRLALPRLALAAALLVPGAGCKGVLGRGAPPAPGVHIVFVNQSTDQASVFAVATSGEAFRIGSVAAGRTETLDIPRSVLGAGFTVTILARRLATSHAVSTGPVNVQPGDEFTVTLPPSGNTLAILPGR